MWPKKLWPKYEERIREAAGLGSAPRQRDHDRYEKSFAHCDVLVVGAGPSGLAAAHAAAKAGARVMLVEDRPELGRSEEHTSELQSLMRISYAVFCFQKTITYLF